MNPPVAQSERAARTPRRSRSREARSAVRSGSGARSNWILVRNVALVVAGAFAVLLLLAVVERIVYNGKVLPGVDVDGVEIEGDREATAQSEVDALADELATTPLRVRVRDQELSAAPELLALEVDSAATVAEARHAGRSRNPFEQVLGTVLRRVRDDKIPLVVHYDDERLNGVIDGWSATTTDGVVEGGLRFEGTTVIPIEPRAGEGILRDEAQERIDAALATASRPLVTLPVGTVQPRVDADAVAEAATQAREILTGTHTIVMQTQEVVITPEQLATAMGTAIDDDALDLTVDGERLRAALGPALAPLEVAPVDASFAVTPQNTVQVVPSQTGRQIDMDAVGKSIVAGQRRIMAPLREIVPAHDTEWAQALGITHQVSSFTTNHPSGQPRVQNIHLAADMLNNTVVEPGQVFSLNDTLGPRTPEKGYVKAPVIGDGEFVDDYGGGVSQLTTTLYNAVFFGGYEDVEHTPHSIYISRYPMGREATINYGVTDLKFRNDTSHGVLIRTAYSATSITVSFYGDNDGRVVHEEDRKIVGEEPITDELIECPAKPEIDKNNVCATLHAGETKKISDGTAGVTVQFTQVIEQPGKPPVRHPYRYRYRMFQNRILVGTAPAPPPTTVAPPTTAPRPTTPTTKPPATTPTT
jgi:vancomycin resistance protein YoaR